MLEHFIDCSEHIVLACRCGEQLIILGKEADWDTRDAIFRCYCGESLTLDDRTDREVLTIKELVRDLKAPYTRREAGKNGETA